MSRHYYRLRFFNVNINILALRPFKAVKQFTYDGSKRKTSHLFRKITSKSIFTQRISFRVLFGGAAVVKVGRAVQQVSPSRFESNSETRSTLVGQSMFCTIQPRPIKLYIYYLQYTSSMYAKSCFHLNFSAN